MKSQTAISLGFTWLSSDSLCKVSARLLKDKEKLKILAYIYISSPLFRLEEGVNPMIDKPQPTKALYPTRITHLDIKTRQLRKRGLQSCFNRLVGDEETGYFPKY